MPYDALNVMLVSSKQLIQVYYEFKRIELFLNSSVK